MRLKFWWWVITGQFHPLHRVFKKRRAVVSVVHPTRVTCVQVHINGWDYWFMHDPTARYEEFENLEGEARVRSILPYDGWGRGCCPDESSTECPTS